MDTYLLNTQTSEIHRLVEGHLSDERCNIDAARDAGHLKEITESDAVARIRDESGSVCEWCRPDI